MLKKCARPMPHWIWCLHFPVGVPPRFGSIGHESLNIIVRGKWAGRLGHVPWPHKSSHLIPLDFYFWGYIKNYTYSRHDWSETAESPNQATLRTGQAWQEQDCFLELQDTHIVFMWLQQKFASKTTHRVLLNFL